MFYAKISKNTEMFRGEISKIRKCFSKSVAYAQHFYSLNIDFMGALSESLIFVFLCFHHTSVWCY